MQKELVEWWDNHHETNNKLFLSGYRGETIWEFLNVKSLVRKGTRVLNIGVGLGHCTHDLVAEGAVVDVLDISNIALDRVRDITENQWNAENLQAIPANTYHLAISHLVSQHMNTEDLQRQMNVVVRSLKVGGVFAMQYMTAKYGNTEDHSLEAQMKGGVSRKPWMIRRMIEKTDGYQSYMSAADDYQRCEFYAVHIRRNP